MNDYFWAPDPGAWAQVAAAIRRHGKMGLDTEFYGCDPSKQSTYGRARVHLWSVAVHNGRIHPRGYESAFGAVLPAEALEFGELRDLLVDAAVVKAVHNLPVDSHSLANHGISLAGAVNTLNAARWYWPELVPSSGGPGFGLKALKQVLLGKPGGPSYEEVFTIRRTVASLKHKKERKCQCGAVPCRRRGAGHVRETVETEYMTFKDEDYLVPLPEVVPGHFLWERALPYAAEDAVDALELYDLCQKQTTERPLPW